MEKNEPEHVTVLSKYVHHHFGQVMEMIDRGIVVHVENGLRKTIVAVILRPDMAPQDEPTTTG